MRRMLTHSYDMHTEWKETLAERAEPDGGASPDGNMVEKQTHQQAHTFSEKKMFGHSFVPFKDATTSTAQFMCVWTWLCVCVCVRHGGFHFGCCRDEKGSKVQKRRLPIGSTPSATVIWHI